MRRWSLCALLTAIVIVINLPVIAMVLNAFQTTADINSNLSFLPRHFTIENFAFLSGRTPYWTFFRNSTIVAALGTSLEPLRRCSPAMRSPAIGRACSRCIRVPCFSCRCSRSSSH